MMMVEKSAKTIEEAIDAALEELKSDRDKVDIEILGVAKQGNFLAG